MAKLSTSETVHEVIAECRQLHGGYGNMNEFLIAQLHKDIRIKRIFHGTSEIVKL